MDELLIELLLQEEVPLTAGQLDVLHQLDGRGGVSPTVERGPFLGPFLGLSGPFSGLFRAFLNDCWMGEGVSQNI